ncbi:MAG: acyl-CoA ligase (AMP-forming), exosortase A system-associated [Proteobacteria bacterium]|nr:acyl-CoA ligase (AMP-forming), exosortase A system-associated [Pseudomonadota bacterium]
MPELLHQSISEHARHTPDATALLFKKESISYAQLQDEVSAAATGLLALGINAGERVAVYLPKQPETVYGIFGALCAGASFVPINPLLKPRQVAYILSDCNVRVLITSGQRLKLLEDILEACPDLHTVVVAEDTVPTLEGKTGQTLIPWNELHAEPGTGAQLVPHCRIDTDMAAILYTSGSTGQPKGVVLSHRNMVAGANSVASYLGNTPQDRLLAVLPLSFDAGLSQLTTAFSVGASVVLMDYLLPRDVIRAVCRYQVTGLAAVPPLWNQLVGLEWPEEAVQSLRYTTNTGGAMPVATTKTLQQALPDTKIFLMYGLTEAFRSTYLPPDQVDIRPESMGKAIPNAEILVINEDGQECKPGEPGELVHRGALVAMGYWNDPEKTAERFKPCPGQLPELPGSELAVWSGDQVKKDEDGYLYFISRKDEMIKTSGYRVSPTEVEEVVYSSGLAAGVVALGLPHPSLGQAILLLVTHNAENAHNAALQDDVITHCRRELPNFMVPLAVIIRDTLPHNQNGKIDRKALSGEYQDLFLQDKEQEKKQ